MIRIIVQEDDAEMAANVGGHKTSEVQRLREQIAKREELSSRNPYEG